MSFAAISIATIDTSPDNPRKTFPKETIEELAESIKSKGLLQPILVRPSPSTKGRFELVAGERRLKASKLAKLAEIDAIVRELSDADAHDARVIENQQREDVHPLEECDGYRTAIEKYKRTAEDVAAKVGKSVSYIYARLKLASLGDEGRKAYLAGKLSHTTALYVARVPPELQAKAVKDLTSGYQFDGKNPISARAASEILRRDYMLRLKGAPFPTNDPELVAGAGTCGDCPKRTGNQKELFGDVNEVDVCTDPICYRKKSDAEWDRQSATAKSKGLKVIDSPSAQKKLFSYGGDSFAYNSEYVDLDATHYDVSSGKSKSYRALAPKDAERVLIRAPSGRTIEAIKRSTVEKAAKKSSSPAAKAKKKSEKAKRELEQRIEEAVAIAVAEKAEKSEPTLAWWRELAHQFAGYSDHELFERRGLKLGAKGTAEALEKLTATQIRGLLAEVAFRGRGYKRELADSAKALGVDAAKIIEREKAAAAAAAKAEQKLDEAKAKAKAPKKRKKT